MLTKISKRLSGIREEVAGRCGHDPAVLLKTYAKRTKKADTNAAAAIGAALKGALGD